MVSNKTLLCFYTPKVNISLNEMLYSRIPLDLSICLKDITHTVTYRHVKGKNP